MGQDIIINQYSGPNHGGTPNGTLLTPKPIPMQLDQMSWKEAADMGGASPYHSYWLRTQNGVGVLNIQDQDLIQDIVSLIKYRVFGQPFTYGQSYVRIPTEMVRGT